MSITFTLSEYKPALIPADPGVYLFRRNNTILYIGKAVHLRKRVSSYFRARVSEKVRQLRDEADRIELIILRSEIEALLKEAELIKRHTPKFNVLMRDDKNYCYVAITQEKFPKIFVTHQPRTIRSTQKTKQLPLHYIGPFTSSTSLKVTLKMLRRFFPYCTCFTPHIRRCLNAELGFCPGYCCIKTNNHNESETDEYKKHFAAIIAVLTGKKKRLVTGLKKKMREAIKEQRFEQAAVLRDQWQGLEDVLSHRMHLMEIGTKRKNHQKNWNAIEKNIIMALGMKAPISRVEGYDISHVSGADQTGSIVVFVNGASSHDDYRMFKITTVKGISDVAALREVIHRRLAHREWQFPDLMVIDGGKPQLNAVMTIILKEAPELARRVVALAKREEELYLPRNIHTIHLNSLPPDTGFFFQRIRDESHRFAKRYHHKLREIFYRPLRKK